MRRKFAHFCYYANCSNVFFRKNVVARAYSNLVEVCAHWRQPRRGCRGHIPNILVGGTSTGISPQYYYVLSDIADQYWLPSVRSASSRFYSAIRRHQFASVRQADSRAYSKRVFRTNCALRIKKCAPRISSGIYFLSTS